MNYGHNLLARRVLACTAARAPGGLEAGASDSLDRQTQTFLKKGTARDPEKRAGVRVATKQGCGERAAGALLDVRRRTDALDAGGGGGDIGIDKMTPV